MGMADKQGLKHCLLLWVWEGICSKQRQWEVILTEELKDEGFQSPGIHHKK